MNIRTTKFELFEQSDTSHALVIICNSRKARRLNALLGFPYPKDTKFTDLDEPVFRSIPHHLLNAALRVAGHKGKG
jgi:hypothetical protein